MFVHVYTHALACIHTHCFNFYQWHRKNLCDKRISVLLKVSIMHSDLSLNSVCITEEYINKSPFHFGACECWMPWVPKLSTESHKKQDAVGGPLIPASQEMHWGPVKGLLMTLASRKKVQSTRGGRRWRGKSVLVFDGYGAFDSCAKKSRCIVSSAPFPSRLKVLREVGFEEKYYIDQIFAEQSLYCLKQTKN